jgi:hypothetical protein
MRMQRIFLNATLLLLMAACSANTERRGPGGPVDSDDSSDDDSSDDDSTDTGSKADAGGKRDAGRGQTSEPTTNPDKDKQPDKSGDDDFAECADKSVDAERGPRGSNIVWVIDNSGSMDEEAATVQQNLNTFVKSIASAGLSDYRVVLITEAGFVQVPAPLGGDTAHFLQIDENVKSDEPLSDLLARYGDFSGFLLKGVVTHFVTVTDDESEVTGENFVTNMKLKLGSEFRVHSVASPPDDTSAAMRPRSLFDDDEARGCTGKLGDAADPGIEHWAASKLTGGLTFSICSEDWSALFTELAKEVGESAAVPCTVELPEPPAGETLDPALINVVFTAPGAQSGAPLPRVDGANSCGDKLGWYYDVPSAPTGILLCPKSCSDAANGGSLKIALGCETFVQ